MTNTNRRRRTGDSTPLGTVEDVSMTAYKIDGTWIPFQKIDGKPAPATGLVTFADGSRYNPATGALAGEATCRYCGTLERIIPEFAPADFHAVARCVEGPEPLEAGR